MNTLHYNGPIVLVVLDGVGIRKDLDGNAILSAHTDFLDEAMLKYPTISLQASGEAVGILPGQMGNSEVGHNALGAGQIIKQGIAKIEDDFATGAIWESEAWRGAIANLKTDSGEFDPDKTLHFSGIFSDGGVHSTTEHLKKMIARAAEEGVKKIRVHLVLDGRDTPPQSAETYIEDLEKFVQNLKNNYKDLDFQIACGGGRMIFTADRYESDWNIVKSGYDAMVHGVAEKQFNSAMEAIKYYRKSDPTLQDQYIPSFVIVDENSDPVGLVQDGDSFIYYDFRADRAIEIAQAFTYEDFPYFDRVTREPDGSISNRRLDVYFAGMTEYNSDTHVPEHQLISSTEITNTLHEFLGQKKVSQLAIAETVKFGHITYYFNGNSYETYPKEDSINIPSDTRPFNERPWMKSAEITDAALENLEKYQFVRINFAGGDMVGHFGELQATSVAMEAIDIQLSRLAKKIDELGGMMIITADHGNAEELIDSTTHQPKTSHTTNPVPCIFYDNTDNRKKYQLNTAEKDLGLTNMASTIATLLGLTDYPEIWRKPIIKVDNSLQNTRSLI